MKSTSTANESQCQRTYLDDAASKVERKEGHESKRSDRRPNHDVYDLEAARFSANLARRRESIRFRFVRIVVEMTASWTHAGSIGAFPNRLCFEQYGLAVTARDFEHVRGVAAQLVVHQLSV